MSSPDKASVPQGLTQVKDEIARDIEKSGDKLDTLREAVLRSRELPQE